MIRRIACAFVSAVLVFLIVAAPSLAQQPQGPAVLSPEILSDHRVVFRILAPKAQEVSLSAGDVPGTPGAAPAARQLTKSPNGVWEITLGPIDPGAYRYRFMIDGVATMDPRNPLLSESNTNAWSLVYIAGGGFMDANQVPHWAVSRVHYYSTALGRYRRMHIYTPPGYEAGGRQKYPVFYLLHGAGDCDDAWTSVGRAGFILDNLLAARKAKPMVVVMPAGHTSIAPGTARAAAGTPDEFSEDFLKDVVPYVEKHYRVLTDRAHQAIAGLSMGGAQTLNISMSHLDRFAYIGVYSSGVFGSAPRTPAAPGAPRPTPMPSPDWEKARLTTLDDAKLKRGLKLLWFATGSEDFLLGTTKATIEMLKKHGFEPVYKETAGGHTWINWRLYLNEFAPQLF